MHVVIDDGSSLFKIGFSGQEAPCGVFQTLVGRPKVPGIMIGTDQKQIFFGHEAHEKRGILKVSQPINSGEIKNWDDYEKLLHNALYTELKAIPEEVNLLLTEPIFNSDACKEHLVELAFENFNVPGFYLANSAALSLFSTGKTNGLVVESGYGVTQSVPIYEGFTVPHSARRQGVAAQDINTYLIGLIAERGNKLSEGQMYETVENLKEKYLVVNCTRFEDDSVNMEKKYVLPDNQTLVIDDEVRRASEISFEPSIVGIKRMGLIEMVIDSIEKSNPEIKKDIVSNVLLCGGNSLMKGFQERMEEKLSEDLPNELSKSFRLLAGVERKYFCWIGGSILSSMSNFQTMWITKAEFLESGSSIIHKKCF